MADTAAPTTATPPVTAPSVSAGAAPLVSARVLAAAFTALRIFTGLVWLSNALAKLG